MNKFWNWKDMKITNEQGEQATERVLYFNGTIAEESWFYDTITPEEFKDELYADSGDVKVWINSPGGDCIAAARIYNLLKEYPGKVEVIIDGIAASAASVIAMAGDKVTMTPVAMMMIHNPSTVAWGDHNEMQKAIDVLREVKQSIINAYEIKTGLSRTKLAHLMEDETWMNAIKAVELGFADEMMDGRPTDELEPPAVNMMFSPVAVSNRLKDRIAEQCKIEKPEAQEKRVNTESIRRRLELLNWR